MVYIERDKVLNRLRRLGEIISEPPMDDKDKCNLELIHRLEKEFSEYPIADVVEVVRCGECKFTDKRCAYGIVCICEHGGMQGTFVSKTDYCNYGRRRDT